jgi:L-methionine (R)-S-oxide reductase|tara:strand:+ start:111 stop:596 length:486 start_codon:yes stop_codon:yes gene_type:complete
MSGSISINPNLPTIERYLLLEEQVKALVYGEEDLIANLSNIMSALKYGMNYFWVGIYKVADDQLVLGPFQGPVACTRILKGRGVCGACWEKNQPIIVGNVDEFPGHIACSSDTKSEIVLPVRNKEGEVAFVLDIDSASLNDFSAEDQKGLEKIVTIIESIL